KEKQHHKRENIHNHLHVWHTRLRLCGHVTTIVNRVNQRTDTHQNGKQTYMIAIGGNVKWQRCNTVVCRKVVGPEKGLVTQLYARWKKSEHGIQNRHLYKHWNTTGEWANSCFSVQLHGSLLLFHRLGILMLFVQFLNF